MSNILTDFSDSVKVNLAKLKGKISSIDASGSPDEEVIEQYKELMGTFKEKANNAYKEYKNSNTMKFISSGIKKLDAILRTMDKILKSHGFDTSKLIDQGSDKLKEGKGRGLALLSKIKDKGALASAKEGAANVASRITGLFKKSNETGTSPPEGEAKTDKPEMDEASKKAIKRHEAKLNKQRGKKKGQKDPESFQEENKPKKVSWIDKALGRAKGRSDEIEAEKKAVQERAKKPKEGGWLGKILSGIMSLGGMIASSLGSLGGFLVRGIGSAIVGIVPGLAGFIAKATAGGLGAVAKGGFLAAKSGITALAGSTMLKTGAIALGRSALMLATGPVGWAVAAATVAYAGYKLYKYFKRNDIADDIYGRLTRLRFMMYGYDDNKKEHYSKLADLDMLMKEQITFEKYIVNIKPMTEEIKEKVLEIFEVNPEDTEKYQILTNWFSKRYVPAFRAYMQALYSVNNAIYIDDLDKLKNQDISDMMAKLNIPLGIHNVTQAPFFNSPDITVSQNQVDDLKSRIVSEVADNIATGKGNVGTSVAKGVVESKDSFAQNRLSRIATAIEKSDNLAVKILKWTPIGMLGLMTINKLSNIYKNFDIYSQLTKLRFMMYGYNDSLADHYDKLCSLEMNMTKYIIYKDKTVTLKDIPTKDLVNFATLFNIGNQQQNDLQIFSEWFNGRFAPAYAAYMQALYFINDKLTLETINKLKFSEIVEFINQLLIPGEIFSTIALPTSDYAVSSVDSETLNDYKDDILSYAKKLAFAAKVKDKALEIGGKIKDKLMGALSGAASWVGDKVSTAANYVKDKVKGVGSWLKGKLIDPILSTISNITKFGIMVFTSNFEGEKIVKLLNIPMAGNLTKLRYMMYGLDIARKEFYIKMANLEMLMSDYVSFKDGTANVRQLDIVAKTKIFDILGIKKDDDEKFKVLDNWFNNRFLPAYTEYMKALYSVNGGVTLDTINKLRSIDVFNFLSKLTIPGSIYNVSLIPIFPGTNIVVTQNEIDDFKANILTEVKASAEKDKEDLKKKTEVNKQSTPADSKPKEEPKPANYKPDTSGKNLAGSLGGEGEPKPNESGQGAGSNSDLNAKVSNKLNKASGELMPGSQSLEGIKSKQPREKIFSLDPNVRELFTGMAKEYNALTGKSITVNEAFRTYEDQAKLYREHPDKAAKPGGSTHEYGLAIDINSVEADELEKMGLMRKYGFTRPIGGERWHLEPIGVSLNPNMAKKDENYRYKAILASPGKGGDGYGTVSGSVLKKRNMEYQLSVYNKNGENVIDPTKAAAEVKGSQAPNLTPSKPEPSKQDTGSTKPTISSAPQIDKDAKPPMAAPNNSPQGGSVLNTPAPTVATNSNIDMGKFADLKGEAAIKQAAKATGMSEQTMLAYAQMESSLQGGSIKNKNSNATGLFQIMPKTWKALVAKHGSKYGIPADATPDNDYYNALMAMEYAKANLKEIPSYKEAGIDESTAIYLAHHYGAGGARKIFKFLKENPNSTMKEAVSDEAYNSNQAALKGMTVASYVQKISNKISNGGVDDKKTLASKSGMPVIGKSDQASGEAKVTPAVMTTASSTPMNKPSSSVSQPYSSNQSPYKTIEAKPAEVPAPQPQQQPGLNKNVESLMNDQLSTLTQIATILKSIDSKFDIDKLKGAMGGQSQPIPPINKGIPKDAVNLSAKRIQA